MKTVTETLEHRLAEVERTIGQLESEIEGRNKFTAELQLQADKLAKEHAELKDAIAKLSA